MGLNNLQWPVEYDNRFRGEFDYGLGNEEQLSAGPEKTGFRSAESEPSRDWFVTYILGKECPFSHDIALDLASNRSFS